MALTGAGRFWRNRGLAAGLTLAASVVISFGLGQLAPGDAFTQLELDPGIPPATLAHLRAMYLPQRSLGSRLWTWLRGTAQGDLGYSLQFHRPVLRILRERLPASIELVTLALLLTWLCGFLLAIFPAWMGERRQRRAERVTRAGINVVCAGLSALPNGLVAVLALLLAPASWLPDVITRGQPRGLPWLPATVLAITQLPAIYFTALNALTEVRDRGYLMQARTAGVAPLRRLWRHALPNTSDVLIPVCALQIMQVMLELVVVETVLLWPGIGSLAVTAAGARDMPLLAALVLLTSTVAVGTNLVSDVLREAFNPRLREKSALSPLAMELAAR